VKKREFVLNSLFVTTSSFVLECTTLFYLIITVFFGPQIGVIIL
jgi:hypothetical protein